MSSQTWALGRSQLAWLGLEPGLPLACPQQAVIAASRGIGAVVPPCLCNVTGVVVTGWLGTSVGALGPRPAPRGSPSHHAQHSWLSQPDAGRALSSEEQEPAVP